MRLIANQELSLVAGGGYSDPDPVIGQGKDYWNDWADLHNFEGITWAASGGAGGGAGGGGGVGTASSTFVASSQSEAFQMVKDLKSLAGGDLSLTCRVTSNNNNGTVNWAVDCTLTINAHVGGKAK